MLLYVLYVLYLTCPFLKGSIEDPVIGQDAVHVANGGRGPDDEQAGRRQRRALDVSWR